MKKELIVVFSVIVLLSVALSGCQDTSSVKTKNKPDNVSLESTIVELANATLEKKMNKSGGVEAMTVGWLLHNIAGRQISADILVKFYDKNNGLLYQETKKILTMPIDYTERVITPANKVTYEGVGATFVDHVVLTVTEIRP